MPLSPRSITLRGTEILREEQAGICEGGEPSIFDVTRMLGTLSAHASEILQALVQDLGHVDSRIQDVSVRTRHAKERQIPHMESMQTRSKQVCVLPGCLFFNVNVDIFLTL